MRRKEAVRKEEAERKGVVGDVGEQRGTIGLSYEHRYVERKRVIFETSSGWVSLYWFKSLSLLPIASTVHWNLSSSP